MKIYRYVRIAIYCALAALVAIFAPRLSEIGYLRCFIGAVIAFYGAEELVLTAVKRKNHYDPHSFYWNVIEMAIGFVLILFVKTGAPDVTYAVVCVAWAIWSILREARELVEVTGRLKENKLTVCRVVSILNMIESVTVIVFSLIMIIEPGEHHARVHLYLLVVELSTKVLFPLINHLAACRAEKEKDAAGKAAE